MPGRAEGEGERARRCIEDLTPAEFTAICACPTLKLGAEPCKRSWRFGRVAEQAVNGVEIHRIQIQVRVDTLPSASSSSVNNSDWHIKAQ